MPLKTSFLALFISVTSFTYLHAEYRITGHTNLKGEWQHLIYLATIDKLDDYDSAKAEHIVNMANIDSTGYFVLEGENLPDHAQFYKLYLIREEHSEFNACLYLDGENHNFIHIILDNTTQIHIEADQNTYAPFGDYTISGDTENIRMKELSKLVYPSYMFYEIRFPSELEFSQNKLNKDLFHFADTCESTLVSLAAINNTDFDAYIQTKYEAYSALEQKLKQTMSAHPYTQNYTRKLRYYSDDTYTNQDSIWKYSTMLLGLLCCCLLYYIVRSRKQVNQLSQKEENAEIIHITDREQKILELIKEGKSNKEIAGVLFIELSTVKSHINKLYSKMGVSNRQEAKRKSMHLQN